MAGSLAATLGVGLGMSSTSGQAAETVVMESGPFSGSVPVSALVDFAQGNPPLWPGSVQEFTPFLQASYVEAVSPDPFRRHLIRRLPPGLETVLDTEIP